MYGWFGFADKLKNRNCVISLGNCVLYMYGLSGFADKLKIKNCVNSTENPELRKFN